MSAVEINLKNLKVALQSLLKAYAGLKNTHEKTVAQHQDILLAYKDAENELAATKQENLILKASLKALDPQDKKQLEQKITSYVKSLEQTIALLSQ